MLAHSGSRRGPRPGLLDTLIRAGGRLGGALLPGPLRLRLREEREWKRWVHSLSADSLSDMALASSEVKRRLFKAHVRLVEVETHARCNRICPFCPNSIVDRRRNGVLAEPEMLERLFAELGSIDYRGQLKIARYSEPLANLPHLCNQLAVARRLVPQAQLAAVTNTDYLTPTVLEQLRRVGLDVLFMSIYLKTGERWTPGGARQYSERLAAKLEVPILSRNETPSSLRCTFEYGGMTLHSACLNFETDATDRGGSLERYAVHGRRSPCREPFETFVVDYDGSVVPCCNIRSDIEEHRDYVVGKLAHPQDSIFDLYAGGLARWRRAMLSFEHGGPSPCATCQHRCVPEASVRSVQKYLDRHLGRLGVGK